MFKVDGKKPSRNIWVNTHLFFSGSQEVDAIDSDSATQFETQNEQDPWFSVDLGKDYFVKSIYVDLRSQSLATKFHPVTVSALRLSDIIKKIKKLMLEQIPMFMTIKY